MDIIIFIVIIYFIYLANSGKKTKKTGWRNIMNEVNNLLTEGTQTMVNTMVWKDVLKKALFRNEELPKEQARKKKVNLYKKNISIPIDILTSADGQSLWVDILTTIYIKDIEKYKFAVWSDDKKIADIIIYHIYNESSNINMNDLMDSTILEEKVKWLAELDLISMWISKIDLKINVKSILQNDFSIDSMEKYISTDREEDYEKQITDDVMWSIWSIEKDIEKTVKDIEKDMDDFVKNLSA